MKDASRFFETTRQWMPVLAIVVLCGMPTLAFGATEDANGQERLTESCGNGDVTAGDIVLSDDPRVSVTDPSESEAGEAGDPAGPESEGAEGEGVPGQEAPGAGAPPAEGEITGSEGPSGALDAVAPPLESAGAPDEEPEPSAAPAAAVPDGWTVDGSGSVRYYAGGSALTGWLVDDGYRSYGLQRYWFDSAGRLVVGSLADVGGGEWAYARPEGFVARGKYVAADGSVYLADNDGRLERAGWVVTDSYDGGMQRYWVDASTHAAATGFFEAGGSSYYGLSSVGYVARGVTRYRDDVLLSNNDGRLASGEGWLVSGAYSAGLERYWLYKMSNGYSAARAGFFTASDGKVYYAHGSSGAVARGKTSYGAGVLLSDNEGVLVENIAGEGWLVTGLYDRGALQRYRIDYSCGSHLGAHVGVFSLDDLLYYGLPSVGYVMRNATSVVEGRLYSADNEGVLTLSGNMAIRLSDGTYQWIDGLGRVNQGEAISKLMNAAHSVLGVPYVWLGKYPEDGGMDCASFTYWCYTQLGIGIDFETYGQIHEGRSVSLSEARPGDLIFMYFSSPGVPEHVVLYAGNGMVYEEPDFGGHCQYVPLSSKNAHDIVVRRILA